MPKRFVPEESKVRELVKAVDDATAAEAAWKYGVEKLTPWTNIVALHDEGMATEAVTQSAKDALQTYLAGPRRRRKSRAKGKAIETPILAPIVIPDAEIAEAGDMRKALAARGFPNPGKLHVEYFPGSDNSKVWTEGT